MLNGLVYFLDFGTERCGFVLHVTSQVSQVGWASQVKVEP